MFSIFKKTVFDNNEELRSKVFADSECGNLVPVLLKGDTNEYLIITGLEWKGLDGTGAKTRKAPAKLENETALERSVRIKPESVQGFADLATEVLEALTMDNADIKALQQAPEFNIVV